MDTKILAITPDVKWIGVLDFDIRTFDIVMETKYGATYNSYFINASKKCIVETVKETFWDTYLEKINQLVALNEIEYIFVNHTEPDHTGSLKKLLAIAPNAKVLASGNAIRYLKDQIGEDFPHIIVKDGDEIDLGNKTMKIIGAANLHWPDSIYSYLVEDKVLFTCDSFGSHYCNSEMYDDKVGNFDDAFKYYFDVILKPFSKFLLKAIEKIRPLEIKAICNGHGPLLTSNWKRYVDLSEQYAKEALGLCQKNKVLVAYVSAYGYTRELGEKIVEGLKQVKGVEVDFCDIEKMDLETLSYKLETSSAYLFGSPTINQNMLPQMYMCFALMSPLRDRAKLAGAFGSYGWSGEAEKNLVNNIQNLKLSYFGESCFVKFRPQQKDFSTFVEYGKRFGQKIIESQCVCND